MRIYLFNPYTGEPRAAADVVDDPEGLQLVDPHEGVRADTTPWRDRLRMPADRALWAPSWAFLGTLGPHCDGRRFGVCWFYGWAVRMAFVAGAEFQKKREISA